MADNNRAGTFFLNKEVISLDVEKFYKELTSIGVTQIVHAASQEKTENCFFFGRYAHKGEYFSFYANGTDKGSGLIYFKDVDFIWHLG